MQAAAQLIRDARAEGGLTQAQLGERLGISQAAIAQLEQPGANPTVARLDDVLSFASADYSLT